MTVEGQHTGSKSDTDTIVLSVILLSIVVSFLGGAVLGEDSIGGAHIDFHYFHWPAIELFSTTSWSTAIANPGVQGSVGQDEDSRQQTGGIDRR